MSSTLVHGKYVIIKITGPDSAKVISDGAIFQRDGEIIEIGLYNDLKNRYTADEVLGSPGYVIMPGLVNNHFHVAITPFQLGIPDLPLDDWLVARMGTKDVDPYLDHLYGTTQMIKSGTTTVQVLGKGGTSASLGIMEKSIKAYEESGMRVSYAPGLSNQNYLVAGSRGDEQDFISQLSPDLIQRFRSFSSRAYLTTEEHIVNMEELCAKYATNDSHQRVRVHISPSNVHRCTDELLLAFKQMAAKHNVPIHIHLQETVYQKMYGIHKWGKTPLQHLYDIGFLGHEVTCAHCVWATDEDIETIAATGTNACHLPSSNFRLQSGIAPINRLLERGIRVGIGTDEGGINDDADMIQEMRLAWKIHRVPGDTPPTAHQIFQMATIDGAYNAGFGDSIGTLEPGKRADIVLMNLQNLEMPYLHPDVSIVDAVVQRGRSLDVDNVMIDGEVVLRDGRFTRIDRENLFKELNKSISQPALPHERERDKLRSDIKNYVKQFHAGTIKTLSPPQYWYNSQS